MKSKLIKISSAIGCIVLVAAIIICSLVFKKDKNNPVATSSSSSSESQNTASETEDNKSEDTNDSDDFEDINDAEDLNSYDEDDFPNINEDDDDVTENDDSENDTRENDYHETNTNPIDDDEDLDEEIDLTEYTNPIQMYGSAKSDNKRDVNIDLDKVIHKDFIGFGDHVFADGLNTNLDIGYNKAFFEFDMSRANVMDSNIARMWFQVDWIVTNTENNPERTDYKNNKDYKNYINGVYDFNSADMKSVYQYVDRYQEIGTDIAINFGWKHDKRIQTWFSMPTGSPYQAAPYDAKAFVNAAVATLKNFIKRGNSNVTYLTYYNEPDNGGDFGTIGDSVSYWGLIARLTGEKLKAEGLQNKISFIGPEQCNFWRGSHNYLDNLVKIAGVPDSLDSYSVHHYFKTQYGDNNYRVLYEDFLYFTNEYKKSIFITEMSASAVACTDENDEYYFHRDWNDTYTSYIIGAANVGVKGVLSWGFGGGYSGMGGWQGQNTCTAVKDSVDSIGDVNQEFYECGLLTNYIDMNSDVLMVDWTGDDIRCAVFKMPNDNYTILVDTKGGKDQLNVTYKLSKKLNRTFYRFMYDRDAEPQVNAIIPACQKEIFVDNSFEDVLEAKEGMYIYTTKKPRKQIKLNKVSDTLFSGQTSAFSADFIDCPTGSNVIWSISAATGPAGSINQNGVYTAASNAKSGDFIAIRATLSSNDKIYATAVIEIKG